MRVPISVGISIQIRRYVLVAVRGDRARKIGISEIRGCLRVTVVAAVLVAVD